MDTFEVDYSNNTNNFENTNKFTNELNNFFAENSNNFVNGDRAFNQWTGKHTDSCEYKQRLNLATKPMEYYVNSLTNISGLNDNEDFFSFTPVGQAQTVHISGQFDRPIPSTLQKTSSLYTPPYSTSPFLGQANNINTLDTDNDLILKAGLELRRKNNQSQLAEMKWPTYGDIHEAELAVTTQKSKLHYPKDLPSSVNPNVLGLNVQANDEIIGSGFQSNAWIGGLSSTNALQNYLNYIQSCPAYVKAHKHPIK